MSWARCRATAVWSVVMVVSGGAASRAAGMSSTPMTARSVGTARECWRAPRFRGRSASPEAGIGPGRSARRAGPGPRPTANAAPQTLAPLLGAALIAIGAGKNYDNLYLTAAARTLIGALAIIPVKKVKQRRARTTRPVKESLRGAAPRTASIAGTATTVSTSATKLWATLWPI
jgi:hypothetical protein